MELFAEGSQIELVLGYRDHPGDPAAAEANRAIVLQALDDLAGGDAERFWSIFHPDVVFHEADSLPFYGGQHRGLEATKQAFEKLSRLFSFNRSVFEQVLAAGDLVMLYQQIEFRVRATGRTGALPVAELFRFREGKVTEWRALYFDTTLVARALTGAPEPGGEASSEQG